MKTFEPQFTRQDIERRITRFISEKEAKTIEILSFIGEQFINIARQDGGYQDQTGNLRNSIGYAIIQSGRIKTFETIGGSETATRNARDLVEKLSKSNRLSSIRIILVGFAGMEYAAAVESKGYEVISNSASRAEEIMKEALSKLK